MNKKNVLYSTFAAAFCLATIACNNAGNNNNGTSDTTLADQVENKIDEARENMRETREENFVTSTLEANAEEIAWIRSGLSNGTDADVKKHAEHMLADHEAMDKDLRAYAAKHNISLDDVKPDETVKIDDPKGPKWDEEWADEMGDQHRAVIRKFERAENRINEPELKGMITKTIPTLKSHLEMMEQLEKKLDK